MLHNNKITAKIISLIFFHQLSYANSYSINLMWINKANSYSENKYIFPAQDRNGIDLAKQVKEWAEAHHDAPINLWYDYGFTTPEQVLATQIFVNSLNESLCKTNEQSIRLRNLRDNNLKQYLKDNLLKYLGQNNNEIDEKIDLLFSPNTPVYFKADFFRILASLYSLKTECPKNQKCSFIYADFDVSALAQEKIWGIKAKKFLDEYGIVFKGRGESSIFENSFFAMNNLHEPLFKAFDEVLINGSLERLYFALNPQTQSGFIFDEKTRESDQGFLWGLGESVFKSTLIALKYYYHLRGFGQLSILGKPIDSSLNHSQHFSPWLANIDKDLEHQYSSAKKFVVPGNFSVRAPRIKFGYGQL